MTACMEAVMNAVGLSVERSPRGRLFVGAVRPVTEPPAKRKQEQIRGYPAEPRSATRRSASTSC